MPDFAKSSVRGAGFAKSPFESFKQAQRSASIFWKVKKAVLAAVVILASFVVSLTLVSFLFLRLSNWRGRGITGITFLSSERGQVLKETTVLWVNPERKEIEFFTIPADLTVHTSGSVSYSLKALYGLHALNHTPPEDFQKALVRNIRIDTPYFIVREGSPPPTEQNLRVLVLKLLFDARSPSNFALADRFALLWYVWFGAPSVARIDFPASIASKPDGLDTLDYDEFLAKHFLNIDIQKEGLSVAVVNASAQSRLASTMGRLFSAFGLNILSVSDTPNILDQGSIVLRDARLLETETLGLLSRYVSGEEQVNANTTNEYRADIVVFLGKKEALIFTP